MTPLTRQSRDDISSPTSYLDIGAGSAGGGSSVSTHSADDQFLQELEAGAMSSSANATQPAWLSGGSSYGSQHSISTSPRQQRDRGASNGSGNQPRPRDIGANAMHPQRPTSLSGSLGSDYGDDESYSNDSGSSAASGDERQPPRHQQHRQRQPGHHRRPTNGPVQPGMMTRENFRPPVPMPIGMPPDPFAASPFPPDPFAPPSSAHASLDAFMPPPPALFQMDSFTVVPSHQPYSRTHPPHQQQQFYGGGSGGAGHAYPLGPDGLATIHSDSEQESNGGHGHSRRHAGQGGRPSTSSSQHQHQSQSPPTEQRRAKIEKERTMAGFSRRPPSRPKQSGRI